MSQHNSASMNLHTLHYTVQFKDDQVMCGQTKEDTNLRTSIFAIRELQLSAASQDTA